MNFINKAQLQQLLDRSITTRELLFIILVVLCLTPFISPPVALLLGFIVAQFIGHPFLHLNQKATHVLLQASVVGLGFSMNVHNALQAGREGALLTVATIAGTLVTGAFLGKWLKIEKKISHLITAGTAICGGSAIAAISPIIKAEEKQISVALGVVFILNSLALFLFPVVGQYLNLSQTQFGLWCAIAIHDTSSVVGAAGAYGAEALEVATTVKLARALWIVPVALISATVYKKKAGKIAVPYFILLFILALVLNTYAPVVQHFAPYLVMAARAGLTLTLFLIGAGLSRKVLLAVGLQPLLQGALLWVAVAGAALWLVIGVG